MFTKMLYIKSNSNTSLIQYQYELELLYYLILFFQKVVWLAHLLVLVLDQ